MSVQRVMAETTSSEYCDWMVFLNEKERTTEKWELYLARIHGAILRIFSAHPERVDESKLLLIPSEEKSETLVSRKKTKEERAKEAKGFWGGLFGLKLGKDK